MTEELTSPARPAVSVERISVGPSQGAQLASGILVDSDVVIVPGPPRQLLDRTGGLRVVIDSYPPDDRAAELIHVTDLKSLNFDVPGALTSSVAVLQLARPSRYVVNVPDFTNQNLAAALIHNGGDLWITLQKLGYFALKEPIKERVEVMALPAEYIEAAIAFSTGLCDWLPCCYRG